MIVPWRVNYFSVSFLAWEVFVLLVLGANMMEMMEMMISSCTFHVKNPAGFDIEKLPFRL